MSNPRIKAAFQGGKAFIPFVTCGDPNLETTKIIVAELARAGAAVIELGIPFSDPTAEGPVIQSANMRALEAGTTTDKVFDMVADLRKTIDTPFVLMTYANVVFHYGIEEFCARAAEVGMDGLILPDVPFEEKEEFAGPCRAHGMDLISMIAPTSEERIDTIARDAEGFIYCVSSLGVTGTRSSVTTDLDSIVARIRAVTDTPIAIGFGISSPEQAAIMAAKSDGAIVGSAIVKIIAAEGENAVLAVGEFARKMVEAVRS